jgi:ABC-type lipopolysaccharide export system ATPase subunit
VRQLTDCGVGVLVADNTNHSFKSTLEMTDRAYTICLGEVV